MFINIRLFISFRSRCLNSLPMSDLEHFPGGFSQHLLHVNDQFRVLILCFTHLVRAQEAPHSAYRIDPPCMEHNAQ